MTSRSEFGNNGKVRSKFFHPSDRSKTLFRDASGTPQIYDSEKSAKNCIGLYTKAAALITEYVAPTFVDESLPTNYEYYASGDITKGLEPLMSGFYLNGRQIQIFAGSIHYFRVHPKYWRDRLRKMKACGLNCVDMVIPWNLHEPKMNQFDWGDGDNDYSLFADPATFLKIVKEEDMFAIIRPGPCVCDEWDFGGLPSWLLRIPNITIRTSEVQWLTRTKIFLKQIFSVLKTLQFQNGGPIIAWQIENRYSCAGEIGIQPNKAYLTALKNYLVEIGTTEMLFTSDNNQCFLDGSIASAPEVLRTIDVGLTPEKDINALKNTQPDKALMISDFRCGNFTSWLTEKFTRHIDVSVFTDHLEEVLRFPVHGISLSTFHGGTNWGFMNGSCISPNNFAIDAYQSNTTSYDCDAPISENGDYNEKYGRAHQILAKYISNKIKMPKVPPISAAISYEPITFIDYLPFNELLKQIPKELRTQSHFLKPMEMMDVNNGNGQSYGYINYRKKNLILKTGDLIKISGRVRDIAMVMVDGIMLTKPLTSSYDYLTFGFFAASNSEVILTLRSNAKHTLDILVENWGRSTFGLIPECSFFKGLEGPVLLNNEILYDWEITCLEMKCEWVRHLLKWQKVPYSLQNSPSMYRAELYIEDQPLDTWIDFKEWCKGVLWVNGYNLGRYLASGSSTTLYIPSPILRRGYNEILIFEHYKAGTRISFVNKPKVGISYESENDKAGTSCQIGGNTKLIRSSGTVVYEQ